MGLRLSSPHPGVYSLPSGARQRRKRERRHARKKNKKKCRVRAVVTRRETRTTIVLGPSLTITVVIIARPPNTTSRSSESSPLHSTTCGIAFQIRIYYLIDGFETRQLPWRSSPRWTHSRPVSSLFIFVVVRIDRTCRPRRLCFHPRRV